jgi:hypothetical protein
MLARLLSLLALIILSACSSKDYRTADRSSAGIAPLPEEESSAIVQIYSARAFEWRGAFAVHTWIATKEENAKAYQVYHVIGWRLRRGLSVVSIENDLPDRRWFDAEPSIIYEIRGEKAAQLIPSIHASALSYPYPNSYRAWPGPNSNTFISHILRENPSIGVELPPHAIGKDWLKNAQLIGWSETGTGLQVSVLGALGLTLGAADGVEVNVLALNFGVDFLRPALKLPFVGRIGMKDAPPFYRE